MERTRLLANSGEVSSQHLVGCFKDECTNLLLRRAAAWLDWMGRDEPERQRAESQWIVEARPLCHLQYPVAYLSCLQRILPAARWNLYFKGKTNLSHDGLNPAHVPYWWVSNPTLGEFCFTMIGRDDIEGSKSNVAMNAWLPQASYPCGNFFDTYTFDFRSRTPLVRTSSELAVRRAGKAPEGTVPSPSPGRHAATRSRRGSSSSSPPTADGFGTGTPVPSPQSQSFSRSYGSILPTSLAYIVPSTRGCSPWRPDAVMSTTGRGRHSVLRIFKGRRERTGHHATCGALPAAGPYLQLSRFQGGQAVKQKRQLFPRLPPASPDFLTLLSTATSWFRNFNPIPFRSTREMRYLSGFPRPLGSTNPCASAVHMEPFPSSAFKVLI
ncbi:hypothetical protein CQW23_35179 [Capsicum baccatum]|uniref:Protein TAR1 n=1 Tax=Capsicum baccatum TaxID=33114 RepID=A0A2G2UWS1_CAPBA|nr:hypothetical protein CQW23_35179 [Capsicum baccatum]